MTTDPDERALRRRVVESANKASERFDSLHGWALAANRGSFLVFGLTLGVGLGDLLTGGPPWPVLAALLCTWPPCHWLSGWCYRRAQVELEVIKAAHAVLCPGESESVNHE